MGGIQPAASLTTQLLHTSLHECAAEHGGATVVQAFVRLQRNQPYPQRARCFRHLDIISRQLHLLLLRSRESIASASNASDVNSLRPVGGRSSATTLSRSVTSTVSPVATRRMYSDSLFLRILRPTVRIPEGSYWTLPWQSVLYSAVDRSISPPSRHHLEILGINHCRASAALLL